MEKPELIEEIVRLQQIVDRARTHEPDVWMTLNITLAQLKSLFFIGQQGTTNLSKLAAVLGVTPTNVTGIVDRLVKKGLVKRTECARDRRILLLQTTQEGKELLVRLRERRRDHMSDVLVRMSAGELTSLAQGFASLVKAIETHEIEKKDSTFVGDATTIP
jgi:DNA-binding MarR family transcriptional regulator